MAIKDGGKGENCPISIVTLLSTILERKLTVVNRYFDVF